MSMQPEPLMPSCAPPRSFAGLLAELAASGKKRRTEPNFDGLEEDVVSLSYEQALRSQKGPLPTSALHGREPEPDSTLADPHSDRSRESSLSVAGSASLDVPGRAKKSASVTIRLSGQQSELLHLRASEAGLTVSSYLRSCAFEVESLRAEVKTTLARLRADGSSDEPDKGASSQERPSSWRRFFSRKAHSKSGTLTSRITQLQESGT